MTSIDQTLDMLSTCEKRLEELGENTPFTATRNELLKQRARLRRAMKTLQKKFEEK